MLVMYERAFLRALYEGVGFPKMCPSYDRTLMTRLEPGGSMVGCALDCKDRSTY